MQGSDRKDGCILRKEWTVTETVLCTHVLCSAAKYNVYCPVNDALFDYVCI